MCYLASSKTITESNFKFDNFRRSCLYVVAFAMCSLVVSVVLVTLGLASGQSVTDAITTTTSQPMHDPLPSPVSSSQMEGGHVPSMNSSCRPQDWYCLDGTCVEGFRRCNGIVDCPDSSDETNATCGADVCKKRQFRCSYGACVDKTDVCNGLFDCVDWSDEHRSLCPNNTICGPVTDLFQCQYSSSCIPMEWICDGVAQCSEDKSDETEATCKDIRCKADQFRCSYGGCVEKSKVCDGSADCADASDEEASLCRNNTCADDMFRCDYGACIYKFFTCDGSKECLDGSDEARAVCPNAPCKPEHFRCDGERCLQMDAVCNGLANCDDASDEFNCSNNTCSEDKFRCTYGACIDTSSVCDGQQDCADGSDETLVQCGNNTCAEWEFRCAYGACLNHAVKCNGVKHCADGSDELPSLCRHVTCERGEFQCAYGPCVSVLEVCNGYPDCADHSDEQQPQCKHVEYGALKCRDGSTTITSFACDGDIQCPDGSDETEWMCAGYSCHAGQFQCNYGGCLSYGTKCDGREDCADKSDETYELCKDNKCKKKQFRCAYGGCVDKGFVCDGRHACADGSDEWETECLNRTCKPNWFKCAYGACIRKKNICNGEKNCVDGSDELQSLCQNNTCKVDEFRCRYGGCVSRGRVCDGEPDCADNSDEEVPQCQHIKQDRFTCADEEVIDGARLCDGIVNCPDGSDETESVCAGSVCHDGQTRCRYGACHLNATKCDGINECSDGSDESYDVCGQVRCILPEYPENGRYTINNRPGAVPGDSLDTAAFSIVCDDGYTVDSSESVFCNNGEWSVLSFPKCVRYCILPNDPSVAFRCTDPGTEEEQSRPCRKRELSGAIVLPSCNGPNFYSTHALPHMTCIEGNWDKIANCTTVCGRVTPVGKTLIAGGRNAIYGELPWHAAIYKKKGHEQICGGSLVNENVILSAAHCFWEYDSIEAKSLKQPAENYEVAVGKLYRRWADNRDLDAQRSDVSQIVLPKQYEGQAKNQQADVAVVVVSRPFEFRPHIRPVCLSFDVEFDNAQLHDGNKGKVAGWGRTGTSIQSSPRLKVVELPYITPEECDLHSPQDFKEYITFDKFCAGFWQGGIAVCKGDSGGGLVFPEMHDGVERYFLRGIVSTAPKNDEPCNVDVYTTMTHVLQHQQFITQHL